VRTAEPQPTPPRPEPGPEQRASPRGPDGSSFVPGLVHELRNFSFGISGSLDAFQARFGQLEGGEPYQAILRGCLGRLNGFLDELEDYGDPRGHPWAVLDLASLLREAVAHHSAGPGGPDRLRLELPGPLPGFRGDGQNLGKAFIHLIGLALGHPGGSGRVTVRAVAEPGGAPAIAGQVESPGLDLPGVDLGRLFEPFYFRAAGFGRLALPVARRVFESHGGSLGAEPAPGGGLRLGFCLPAGQGGAHGQA